MHIGLIGGVGPAATTAYYQRLTADLARREARAEITIVHAQTRDGIARLNADDRAGQAEVFARLIDRLKSAGADCAAITSIAAHFCFEETAALSSLPLVSAIAPLDAFFVRSGLHWVGLLGAARVMRSRFFGQLARTGAVVLEDEVDSLGNTYLDMAVAGICSLALRALFLDAGARLMQAGAQAVVLAGTDLNLAFDGQDPGYPVIDALDVHVALLADLATGRAALDGIGG